VDAPEHGKIVLGAILGHQSRAALDEALRQLTPSHFPDHVQANLFSLCEAYLDQTGGVLTRDAVHDVLRQRAPGESLMYVQYYDMLAALRPEVAGFRWSVEQLRELAAERATGEALTAGMTILREGLKEGRDELRGHADARTHVMGALSAIDRDLRQAVAPEGDMRHEADEMMKVYAQRKYLTAAGTPPGISTSIALLDELLGGGIPRGALAFIMGSTSAGKTSLCVQLAWHAAMSGKNVVYFTTETLRPQVRIKLLARHSRHPKFGLRDGLNSRDLKAGTLTPQAEVIFASVIRDFAVIPGVCYVAQVPKNSTVDSMAAQLERITRVWTADLVIIDYVQLLRPAQTRRQQWEETTATLRSTKEMSVGYHSGLGVPVISPWQVSRDGKSKARERGFYIAEDMADAKEASNIADLLVAILEPAEWTGGRHCQLVASVPKNRDGEARFGRDGLITLDTDYATSYFEARASASSDSLLTMPSSGSAFGDI
jgi:replicative DNA helicase